MYSISVYPCIPEASLWKNTLSKVTAYKFYLHKQYPKLCVYIRLSNLSEALQIWPVLIHRGK
jgi:hypothetical protein